MKFLALFAATVIFCQTCCANAGNFTLGQASYRQRGILSFGGREIPIEFIVSSGSAINVLVCSEYAKIARIRFDGKSKPLLECKISEALGNFLLRYTMLAAGFRQFFEPEILHCCLSKDNLPLRIALVDPEFDVSVCGYKKFAGITLPETVKAEGGGFKMNLRLVEFYKKNER